MRKRKMPVQEPISEARQKQYERQARLQYGPEIVNESVRRWASYSPIQQAAIQAEGGQVYLDLADALEAGLAAGSADVNAILARWHARLRSFYEPTPDILRGLGVLYNSDPEFMAFFQRFHPDLTPYLQAVITAYVEDLETRELERMLAEDAVKRLRGSS
jgi:hypothetical protein